ncbi:MAG: class I SAM-dependent methyltransferase [Candidatus Auribacterota bacterium]|jgi:SAM-dependent methyltransferase|nr:class I SAM-dependent methyltransferase [Candidatus Auribacterota bacterium]
MNIKKKHTREKMSYKSTIPVIRHLASRYLPEIIKRPLVVFFLLIKNPPSSAPPIPQHLVENCRFFGNRTEMLEALPKKAIVCEVGTLYGDFSRKILERSTPSVLHLLDIDFSPLYQDVQNNPHVRMHKGPSYDMLKTFPDEYFDWIYIDGDHTYQGVKADIEAAIPKLKKGGYLVFNDFARILRKKISTFGVHQAVCEFASDQQWPFTHFAFEQEALYDVALQKPESNF